MGAYSRIAWTHHTFNPIWGCEKISPGCANCYAATFAKRTGSDVWGAGRERKTFSGRYWEQPHKWNREAEKAQRRDRVFCASMTDWCLDDQTMKDLLPTLFNLIRWTPWLDWLLLTKRADRIRMSLPQDWGDGYPNVWLGVSVENREHRLPRIDFLREIPARVRFLSIEPLLEDLGDVGLEGIDWVIVGGESGPGHRPMHHDWVMSIRDQCRTSGVAFFFKQSSGPRPGQGCELDGEIHQEFPETIEGLCEWEDRQERPKP